MSERWVAVLGRRDEPTDAVAEYCDHLSAALVEAGITLKVERLAWRELGWQAAMKALVLENPPQDNKWFFLQYNALAWSRRGFPWRFLSLIKFLQKRGARCAVVFHDAEPYFGNRVIDRIRRGVQLHTMRRAAMLADLSVLTVPTEKIQWLAARGNKTVFIPVGANLTAPEKAWTKAVPREVRPPGVAVFAISGGPGGIEESRLVAEAVLYVAERIGPLRLVVLGRNSESLKEYFQEKFLGSQVQLTVRGVLPAEETVSTLGSCDAMLFVRGPISSRRGSAIAGIACGLPVIAQSGWETAAPITEAGVALVPAEGQKEFGPTLLRVLTNTEYRASLSERSRRAQEQYFSWPAIAAEYLRAIRQAGAKTDRNS